MTSTEVIAIIATLLGGGGLWGWLLSRRKTQAEAVALANKAALDALLQSTEFLKSRVGELENANTLLREQLELQTTRMEEKHESEMDKLEEQKQFFQGELEKTRAAMRQMGQEFQECKANLTEKTEALARTQERMEDYLKRFPQFTDRPGTGRLNPKAVQS